MSERRPAIVVGYLIRYPVAGMAWVALNWLLALRDLGYEPVFMEAAVGEYACWDVAAAEATDDPGYGIRFLEAAARTVGLDDLRWWYTDGRRSWGMSDDEAAAALDGSAVLCNVGASSWCSLFRRAPRKVLVDCDAPLTQIALAEERYPLTAIAAQHDVWATTAVNVAEGRVAGLPSGNRPWLPALPPVHLGSWPAVAPAPDGRWTTVTSWNTGATATWNGRFYGQKDRSYEPLLDLPSLLPEARFELAVASNAPLDDLRGRGWSVVDPVTVTATLAAFAAYVRGSRAELAVAKHAFVAGATGQMNDRSLLYLASGRPVVASDTGLSWLPPGKGLLTFTDGPGAARAVGEVEQDLAGHAAAARMLAERFDAATVVGDLLAAAGVEP